MIRESNIIISPGVGRFWPSSDHRHNNGDYLVGYLHRLDEKIPILIPNLHGSLEYLVEPGALVSAGLPIAKLTDSRETPLTSIPNEAVHRIVSPADGFLTCLNDVGMPFKKKGDSLKHGDIIAILEFMKIRMEILYDGTDGAMFDHYEGTPHRSIKKGECIAVAHS